jgi:hypothetical protein
MSRLTARPDPLRPAQTTAAERGLLHDRRFLFLHIPKTGGTSLLTLLGNAFGERHLRRLGGDELRRAAIRRLLASPAMRDIDCLAGHFPAHAFGGRLAEFQVFTILRHPVERVMSLYRFLRRQRAPHLRRMGLRPRFGLEDFLGGRAPELFGQVRNGMCRMLCNRAAPSDHERDLFWREQLPAEVVEQALATLRRIEFGLAERMPETLGLVQSLLGLPFDLTEHVENVSGPAGRERATANVLRLMELNAADLALYQLAEPLFRARLEGLLVAAASRPAMLPRSRLARLPAGVETELRDLPGRQGFHQYEPDLGFSWLVGTAPARLAFLATPGPARLRLRAFRIVDAYPVEQLGVAVNGTPVAHRWQCDQGQWGVLETEPFLAAELNVVALSVPYTLPTRFLLPASQDRRQLSVAVSTLMLTAP